MLNFVTALFRPEPQQSVGELLALGTAAREAGDIGSAVKWWQQADRQAGTRETKLFLLSGLHEADIRPWDRASLRRELSVAVADLEVTPPYDGVRASAIFEAYGFVILRRFIPPQQCALWHENLMRNILRAIGTPDSAPARVPPFGGPVAFVAGHAQPDEFFTRFETAKEVGNEYKMPYTAEDHVLVAEPIMTAIRASGLESMIQQFLGKQDPAFHLDNSAARYTKPIPGTRGGGHQDGKLQNRTDRFVTFWIPFVPCGPGVAPTLALLPVKLSSYFPVDDKNLNVERSCLPEPLWIMPHFDPGDVVLHSTYNLHKTVHDDAMTASRSSMDIRYF